jgi:transposase
VAKNNKLTEEEVWSMVKAVANKILPIDVKKLQKLGIDEISLVKGQVKFIVVLVDLSTHKLIGLVADRKQGAIEKKMLEWGEEVLNQIEEVSMDREHPDFASMQKYDKIYPFVGKPTLSFPKKSVLESMSHFIAIEE